MPGAEKGRPVGGGQSSSNDPTIVSQTSDRMRRLEAERADNAYVARAHKRAADPIIRRYRRLLRESS